MDWRKLIRALLFPPWWLLVLLSVASALLLTAVFVKGWETAPVAYGIYVLSFYTLCVVTVYCSLVLPKQLGKIRQRLHQIPFFHRFMTDRAYRMKIMVHVSLGINVLYIGINLWSWHNVRSWWFVVLAAYYGVLVVLRSLLAGYVRKDRIGANIRAEWKRARVCACVLLLVNLSLSGAVLMILYQNKGYGYPGIMIYVMAMYTFYSTIHAAVDLVRYRGSGSPVMSTAKIVSLSAALVSMLNLETAMFAQFGGELSVRDQRLFIILTGAGISITVVTLSVSLIVKATKEIGRTSNGGS